uniref:cytochrome-c oxidase n=1 Tax=Neomazocraes dorosomatis TaxID=1131909 RepID=A0A3G0WS84_9PLAT|nr:cytochrome c oxidase subunit II [Neomazocraes dorosomatis]
MTSNLYSFCSHPLTDVIIVYSWCLSIFISIWVIGAILVSVFGNHSLSFRSLNRVSFDKVESFLIVFSSLLIIILILINLVILRSHSPWYYNTGFNSNDVVSIDVIGRQWYWVYSMLNISEENESFDSYINNMVDCVDNSLNLGLNKIYSLSITSADVLHSFALPSAQLKVDAVPGRSHNVYILSNVLGRHIGYCSEFCGAGHSYMPIVLIS